MQKFHVMPFVLELAPVLLSSPLAKPSVIRGVIRWTAPDWNENEYEGIERVVDSFIPTLSGKEVPQVVEGLGNLMLRELPDRNFSVTLGSFGIERKIENEPEEES